MDYKIFLSVIFLNTLLSYFKKSNKIIVTDNQIRILKNKTLIFTYEKRSILDGTFIIFK